MIKVIATKKAKEEKLQELLVLTEELVRETLKEEGCISYEACSDIKDPCKMVILEAWESQEALTKHQQSEHFKRLVPRMAELCQGPSEVSLYSKLY